MRQGARGRGILKVKMVSAQGGGSQSVAGSCQGGGGGPNELLLFSFINLLAYSRQPRPLELSPARFLPA